MSRHSAPRLDAGAPNVMAFTRILCPIDFSTESRHALGYGVAIGHLYQCSITALHVYPVTVFPGVTGYPPFLPRAPDIGLLERNLRGFLAATVLRVARALSRSGVRPEPALHSEQTPVGVRLRVVGLIETRASAARLAAGKHLLDLFLRQPLLIESVRKRGLSAGPRPAAWRSSPPMASGR